MSATSRKRKRLSSEEPEEEDEVYSPSTIKNVKASQIAQSRSITIPVDEYCPGRDGYTVHIADDGKSCDEGTRN